MKTTNTNFSMAKLRNVEPNELDLIDATKSIHSHRRTGIFADAKKKAYISSDKGIYRKTAKF